MQQHVEQALQEVMGAAMAVRTAASQYGKAAAREITLETERPRLKSEAIARLMSQPDPQKDGKLYSATAAEAVVTFDAVYAQHRADQAAAAATTIEARGHYEAAKVGALVRLELLKLAVAREATPPVVIG